jgi:hypothetical protein
MMASRLHIRSQLSPIDISGLVGTDRKAADTGSESRFVPR